jgi:hypothetical protein
MAAKPRKTSDVLAKAVTSERAARLYRLLQSLARGPQTRTALARRLGLDVRGFYRDLELLRASGIDLPLVEGRYTLRGRVAESVVRLPFPDPHISLGEAVQLSKGRTAIHRRLKQQIARIIRR